MKKRKLNALIAAGCFTFLAPMGANAEDLGTIDNSKFTGGTDTDKIYTPANENNTFSTINVGETGVNSYSIKTQGKELSIKSGETGFVALDNNAQLIFSDAVAGIALGNVTANGDNKIKLDVNNTAASPATTNLTAGNVSFGTSATKLTLENNIIQGNSNSSLTVNKVTLDGGKAIWMEGNGKVEIASGVDVSGTGNEIHDTLNNHTLNKVNIDASSAEAGVTLENIRYSSTGNNYIVASTGANDVTVNLKNSDLGEMANATDGVKQDQHFTVKTVKNDATNTNTIGNIYLSEGSDTAGTKLTLDTDTTANGASLSQRENTSVTLNAYSTLETKGANQLTLNNVKIIGNNAKITAENENANSRITTITMDNGGSLTIDGSKAAKIDGVTATVGTTSSISNANTQADTTLGALTVGSSTQDTTTKLTINSNLGDDTKTTNFTSATLVGKKDPTQGGTDHIISELVLNANTGKINATGDVNLDGYSTLTLEGSKATTFANGIKATDRKNTVNNKVANNNLNKLTVEGKAGTSSNLTVTATENTKFAGADVQGITSTPTAPAVLELNAASGKQITLNNNETVNLKGQAQLNFNGAGTVALQEVDITGIGNTISKEGTSTTHSINKLVLNNASDTDKTAALTVDGALSAPTNGTEFNADENTVTANNGANLGTLSFKNDNTTQTATVNNTAGTGAFTTTTVAQNKKLTLSGTKADTAGLTGQEVALNGGELDLSGKVTLSGTSTTDKYGVKVANGSTGTVKITGNDSDNAVALNNIRLGSGNIELTLDNVKTTNYTNISKDNSASSASQTTLNVKNGSQLKLFDVKAGDTIVTNVTNDSNASLENRIVNTTANLSAGVVTVGNNDASNPAKLIIDANANTKYTNATVNAGSSLELNATPGGNIEIASNTNKTTLKGGANDATTASLKITNPNGKTVALGDLDLSGNTTLNNVKSGNYTTLTLADNVVVNMYDTELSPSAGINVASDKSATFKTFLPSGATAKGSTVGNLNLAKGTGTDASHITTLNLQAGATNLTAGNITMNGNSKVDLQNSTGTLAKGSFYAYDDNNVIENNNAKAGYEVGDLFVGTSSGTPKSGKLTLVSKTATTYNNATVDNNSTLTLDATAANVVAKDGSSTIVKNSNLTVTNPSSKTVDVKTLNLQNTVGLNNVKKSNYSAGLTLSDDLTATLVNSEIINKNATNPITVTSTHKKSFTTGTGNTESTIGKLSLTGASGNDNKATAELTASVGKLNAGTIAMNGYSELNTKGTGELTTGAVTATATGNVINNENTSTLDKFIVGSGTQTAASDLTLNAGVNTTFKGADVVGATGNISTLTLNTDLSDTKNGTITSTGDINLQGNAKLALAGSEDISLADKIKVSGMSNTIENANSAEDGTLGDLVIGTQTGSATTAGLTIKSTANDAVTNFGEANVRGAGVGTESVFELNADSAAITNEDGINLNGNAKLITSGSKNITIGSELILSPAITATGTNNTIDNANVYTSTSPEVKGINLGYITVGDDDNTQSALTIQSTSTGQTAVTNFHGADVSGNATLNLDATNKEIKSTDRIELNGGNNNANTATLAITNNTKGVSVDTVRVSGNVTLDNVQNDTTKNYSFISLGTGVNATTINLKNGSDVVNDGTSKLYVYADHDLTINNIDTETSNIGTIDLNVKGTGTTKLTLDADKGNLNISDIAMNGGNEVNIKSTTGGKTVTGSGTITAVGTDNVINNSATGSNVGNLQVGKTNGDTTTGNLTVNANAATTNFNSATVKGNSSTERSTLTLDAGTSAGGAINGTKVTLQGNTNLDLKGTNKITLGTEDTDIGVDVFGKNNHITNYQVSTTNRDLNTINLNGATEADVELYTANLLQGRDFDRITGAGTIIDEGTNYGDLIIDGDRVMVENTTGNFDDVDIYANKTLTLNTTDSNSKWVQPGTTGVTDTTITMNEGSKIKFNDNYDSEDVTKGHGSINLNQSADSKVLVNGTSSMENNKGGSNVNLNTVEFGTGRQFSTDGNFTYNVKQNGTDVLNTKATSATGTTTIGTITTKGNTSDTFTVNSQLGTTSVGNVVKSDSANTNLVLNADGGNIEYTNASKLSLTDGDSISISDNGTNYVKFDKGLSISNTDGNYTTLSANTTTTGADASTFGEIALSDAVLHVTGLNGTNHSFGTIAGTNTIQAADSSLNGVTIASSETAPTIVTVIAGSSGTGNDVTVNGATVTGATKDETVQVAEYKLNALNNDIAQSDGTTIALNGNAKLTTTGSNNITGLAVTATGNNNAIATTNKATYDSLALTNAVLNVTGLNTDITTQLTGNNTIKVAGSTFGDFQEVAQDKNLTIEAVGTSSQFGDISLAKGSGTGTNQQTTLDLKPTDGSLTGANLTLKGNSITTIHAGNDTNKASLNGDINVASTNNVINNNNLNTFSANKLVYSNSSNSDVTLQGSGNFRFANGIEVNKISTLNTYTDVSTGDVNFNNTTGDELRLNAYNGHTSLGQFTADAGVTKNITLYASAAGSNDGSITKNSNTTLYDGDTLKLTGNSDIELNGLQINGTGYVTATNANATVGNLTISNNSTLDTDNNEIDTIYASRVNANDDSTWNLDNDVKNLATGDFIDKIVVDDTQPTSATSTIDFNISDVTGTSYDNDRFVKYVQIADVRDDRGNQVNVLGTTMNDTEKYKMTTNDTNNTYYYSYATRNDEQVNNDQYTTNTIRFTNYKLVDDLLEHLTRAGSNDKTLVFSGNVHNISDTDQYITALPNMVANREFADIETGKGNELTLMHNNAITGQRSTVSRPNLKLFTVDSSAGAINTYDGATDLSGVVEPGSRGVSRDLTINGISLNHGASDNANGNTTPGGAIYAVSDGTADTTISLNPYELTFQTYYEDPGPGQTQIRPIDFDVRNNGDYPDKYNYDSYTVRINKDDPDHYVDETKDVAFYGNTSTQNGGAIYSSGATTVITTTSSDPSLDPERPFVKALNINPYGVRYTNNVAGQGAIIDPVSGEVVTYTDPETGIEYQFPVYYADKNGGAIYNTNGAKYISKVGPAEYTYIDTKSGATKTYRYNSTGTTSFDENVATGRGGAIFNDSVIRVINPETGEAEKVASMDFQGDTYFTNNYAMNISDDDAQYSSDGGAIYNTNGAKMTFGGDTLFDHNASGGDGGAIANVTAVNPVPEQQDYSEIELNNNNYFVRNIALGNGGALYNNNAKVTMGHNSYVDDTGVEHEATTTLFHNNEALVNGGAHASVNNELTVNGNAEYKINTALGSWEEKVYDPVYDGDGNLVKDGYTELYHVNGNGGAIVATEGSLVTLNGGSQTFTNNKAGGLGGAIYMKGIPAVEPVIDPESGDIIEPGVAAKPSVVHITASGTTKFQGNKQGVIFHDQESAEAAGIYDETTMKTDDDCDHLVYAEDGTHIENGKVVQHYAGEHVTTGGENNAIYFDGNATLELQTVGKGNFQINDKIASNPESTNNRLIQNGTVYYNNDMSGYNGTFELQSGVAHFNLAGGPTTFGSELNRADYIMHGGATLDVVNGRANAIYANNLDLSHTSANNPFKMMVDMDLTNEIADHFNVTNSTSGHILVNNINLLGDTRKDSIFFPIVEREDGKEAGVNVTSTISEVVSPQSEYAYDVIGQTDGLLLKKQDTLDTGVLAPQIAVNARLAGQLDLMNNILHRVDEIAENRYFHKVERNNLYANDPNVIDTRALHIDEGYTPYVNQEDGGCVWVKGNATIENIAPSGQDGYKNRAYNAFIGYETPVATMKNGWDLINTVFGGYQGSFQDYDLIENYQNGGSGGYMANLYHNNFFAGGVVMMGGTNVETQDSSKFGRDMNFGLFDIGASVRTGYNVGMGKHWLFQPMLTASYIYITGLERHNGRGEDVHLDGTSTIQIAPGFKIVGNYKGWKPYVLFDYTWPILAKTVANVNDIDLDDVGLKSYVEYGVGLRKDMGERFTGHVEAVMRHGGRKGISFQGGLVFKF